MQRRGHKMINDHQYNYFKKLYSNSEYAKHQLTKNIQDTYLHDIEEAWVMSEGVRNYSKKNLNEKAQTMVEIIDHCPIQISDGGSIGFPGTDLIPYFEDCIKLAEELKNLDIIFSPNPMLITTDDGNFENKSFRLNIISRQTKNMNPSLSKEEFNEDLKHILHLIKHNKINVVYSLIGGNRQNQNWDVGGYEYYIYFRCCSIPEDVFKSYKEKHK